MRELSRYTYWLHTPLQHCRHIRSCTVDRYYSICSKALSHSSMHRLLSKYKMKNMFVKLAWSFEPLDKL